MPCSIAAKNAKASANSATETAMIDEGRSAGLGEDATSSAGGFFSALMVCKEPLCVTVTLSLALVCCY